MSAVGFTGFETSRTEYPNDSCISIFWPFDWKSTRSLFLAAASLDELRSAPGGLGSNEIGADESVHCAWSRAGKPTPKPRSSERIGSVRRVGARRVPTV